MPGGRLGGDGVEEEAEGRVAEARTTLVSRRTGENRFLDRG